MLDDRAERMPWKSKHEYLAWIHHEYGSVFLRQLLDLIMEDGKQTRQGLELCVAEYKARNMVELAEIVQEYAAKCPDMWDLRFCPEYWSDSPDQWVASVKRCGHN
jgi:hypothetical protein